jgi:predicted ATP-grasp superfamily ATP-dependent carboligase
MKTVLLTNGQQRKTLAAARSLGKKGIKVIAAEETSFNPTAFSKYCSKFLVYPSPKKSPEEFYKWLCLAIVDYNCDILFPMDDDVLEIVMEHYEELSNLCSIPVPSKESYEIACDKGRATETAMKAGVSCPETIIPANIEELNKIASKVKLPAVIKPRKSSGSRGIRAVYTKEELISQYLQVHEQYPFPMIQEKIGLGERFDVCLLYDNNNSLKASFVQKELRHFPVDIGPSTLQESVVSEELMNMALAIMGKLPWKGIAELEFMIDSNDRKPKFMEINTRFWASLQTAIYAGVDFPWLLYGVALENEIENCFKYKEGVKCSWLLPGDILHFVTNKNRFKMNPPFLSGKKHGVRDDIISREDLLPVLGFFLACLRYVFDLNMWKLIFKR